MIRDPLPGATDPGEPRRQSSKWAWPPGRGAGTGLPAGLTPGKEPAWVGMGRSTTVSSTAWPQGPGRRGGKSEPVRIVAGIGIYRPFTLAVSRAIPANIQTLVTKMNARTA